MTIQQIDSSSIPYQILDPEGNLVEINQGVGG